jgi:hypothetical protein
MENDTDVRALLLKQESSIETTHGFSPFASSNLDPDVRGGLTMLRKADNTLHEPSYSQREASVYELILFFGCGMGSSLCYIATLSSLVYFMMQYGANSYVYLNVAVYFPFVPISLAQARWDQNMDKIYGSVRTFISRGIVGFVLSIAGTLLVLHVSGPGVLVISAVLQGSGGAVLLGSLNQMSSFVDTTSGRLKAAVSAGVQASALVILLLSLATDFGSSGSSHNLKTFFTTVTLLELICLVMFLVLMTCRSTVATSMLRRDSSILDMDPLLQESVQERQEVQSATPNQRELSYSKLFEHTWKCCIILLITLIPSFLVGSWFTQVRTHWMQLPQILFYTRIGCDFLGRAATTLVIPKSVKNLSYLSFGRLVPVAMFFINSSIPWQGSDICSILLVGSIAFLSGYLVTGCFQLAPGMLQSDIRDTNVARQTSLLNVAFSFAAFGGILLSFLLIAFG